MPHTWFEPISAHLWLRNPTVCSRIILGLSLSVLNFDWGIPLHANVSYFIWAYQCSTFIGESHMHANASYLFWVYRSKALAFDWVILGWSASVNTLRPRQNGRHFADTVFKCIFLNENVWISLKISLKFVPKVPINNIPSLVQAMTWRHSGDKSLSEPMMVSLLTHICVTWPQWVILRAEPHATHMNPTACTASVYCFIISQNIALRTLWWKILILYITQIHVSGFQEEKTNSSWVTKTWVTVKPLI